MENPLFGGGKTKLDPETVKAARKALAAPCAVCGSTDDITARQIVPRKPQAFCIPATAALFVPLCPLCLYLNAVDIEAHLLTTRIMQAGEFFGWDFSEL